MELVAAAGAKGANAGSLSERAFLVGMLSMAEAIERGHVEKFEPELEEWGLDLASLQRIENESYTWVHGMSLSSGT